MVLHMENLQNNSYRYERKFLIPNVTRVNVEQLVLQHPALFSEIYHDRYVNNIYFDFIELRNFMDNIMGNMQRIKHRIRWYGDLLSMIEKPVLELKIKEGIVGTKRSFKLNQFNLNKGISAAQVRSIILNSEVDTPVKSVIHNQIPVLLNRYKRKYFQSADKKFRITIDDEQMFVKFNTFNNSFMERFVDHNQVVMELKYEKQYESEAAKIVNCFPYRLTKSSKYARGVQLFFSK